MEIKNIDEQFLLALLDTTDSVYYDKNDKPADGHFYFHPKGLNCKIKIPCDLSSNLTIQFCFNKPESNSYYKEEDKISFSTLPIEKNKKFLSELYKKHEAMLNSYDTTNLAHESFEKLLKSKLTKNSPYSISYTSRYSGSPKELENIIIKSVEQDIQVNLGRAIAVQDNAIQFNPLDPIVIDCFLKNPGDTQNTYLKKVIPAYLINDFPIVKKYTDINKYTNNIHTLTDLLRKQNQELSPMLEAIILNIELPEINKIDKNRLKI